MSSVFKIVFLLFSFELLLACSAPAQQSVRKSLSGSKAFSITRAFTKSDSVYRLTKEFIIEGTDSVFVDSTKRLRRGPDYRIDYRYGTVMLTPGLIATLAADTAGHALIFNFRAYPLNFKRQYSLHHLEIRRDSLGQKKSFLVESSSQLFSDDFFGPGLRKSGSIVRGFTIGSNRDLSLNSGFRMQLAGRLAQDIDVSAALTDENTPIQPEGTTQTLREVDKVYVEIKNPRYSATLGDFNLQTDQKECGEFGRVNRKLQGAQGNALFEEIAGSNLGASVSITGATARGKYASNQFLGIDGVQGPYRLTGPNGESRLIIVAGSERVYLDGESMMRGETNDYIIDYSSGEVTFSSRRLITNASRITIDFEYMDQQYIRNLVAGSVSGNAFGNALNLHASFIQEADDPDSPVDASLDDSTRSILQNSGADRLKASRSGIQIAGRDSLTGFGKGQYLLRDTSIGGKNYRILIYAPGDTLAVFSAAFSPVDRMPPDSAGYIRVAAGQYQFAGIGQGNYLPVRFLPMPQRHQLFDANGQAFLGKNLSLSGEFATSRFDRNRFSPDGSRLQGGAFKFGAHYNPKRVVIAGANIGEIDAAISERMVDRAFVPLDRTNEVEFNRKWDVNESAEANEEIRELSIAYRPIRSLSGGVSYGLLNRPGEVQSSRTQVQLGLTDSTLPITQYQIENIRTSSALQQDASQWIRQRGTMLYSIAQWQPGLRIEEEERTATGSRTDSLEEGSFRYIEIAPRLATSGLGRMTASVEFQFRTEDSAAVGSLQRASKALTQLYTWQLSEWRSLSSTLSLSTRSVEFTDEYRKRGNPNTDAVLIRSQTRYTPFKRAVAADFYYEFANQRSARMERVFVRVAQGTGNYRYLGDLNGNGIPDENEFELTRFDGDYVVQYVPSDQLSPVADLKASVRLRLQPARLVTSPLTGMQKFLKAISSETYLRVDENSSDPDTKQIYLLNFNHFLNDQTTIAGSNQITQDVFLFENDPALSLRFRFDERRGLTQFVSSTERSYLQERSVRIRSQLVSEIGNQTDIINKTDRVDASSPSNRERDLESNALLSTFSYRPVPQWEAGFNFGFTAIVNHFGGMDATASINELGLTAVRSFPGIGQLRAEITREEVTTENLVVDALHPLPYEFTEGKALGKSYLWQVTFDYRITANLQLSLNYNGRSEGGRAPVHLGRMEARAFF
jgi:hypothetical protein